MNKCDPTKTLLPFRSNWDLEYVPYVNESKTQNIARGAGLNSNNAPCRLACLERYSKYCIHFNC